MSELEKIFYNYMGEKENDSEEIISADKKLDTYMKQFLNHEILFELDTLVVDCNIVYEKQGFLNGFRYAVKLLTCN